MFDKPTVWYATTIHSILTNEKYKGDALLQKGYTVDFLQKKHRKNNGEIPQYYVEGHHEAIVSSTQFEYVQEELKRRKKMGNRFSGKDIYSSKIQCGCCGCWYGPVVWHSNDKYRRVVYKCNRKLRRGEKKCTTPHFTKKELQQLFLKGLNSLIEVRKEVKENLELLMGRVADISGETDEKEQFEKKLKQLATELEETIRQRGLTGAEREKLWAKEDAIRAEYASSYKRLKELGDLIDRKKYNASAMENFISVLDSNTQPVGTFQPDLWGLLVEKVVVNNKDDIQIVYRGGYTINVK